MNAKEAIMKAMKRARNERGLRVSKPNNVLSGGHMGKADHNLVVMTDLGRLGHEDWVVISAYYAMYHSATALLAKIGLESKDHATTAAALKYFFGEHVGADAITKFDMLKARKDRIESVTISEKYIEYLWKIKRARETVQYGISMNYGETDAIMDNAREFVSKMKLAANGLDEQLADYLVKKIRELEKTAKE